MTVQREPQHGYRGWTVLRCEHCHAEVSGGTCYENAVERAPEEAVIIEEKHPNGIGYVYQQFCDAECQRAWIIDTYGEEGES